jgi:hypothetical protein
VAGVMAGPGRSAVPPPRPRRRRVRAASVAGWTRASVAAAGGADSKAVLSDGAGAFTDLSTGMVRTRRVGRAVSDRTEVSPPIAKAAAGIETSDAAVAALPPGPRRVRAVSGRGGATPDGAVTSVGTGVAAVPPPRRRPRRARAASGASVADVAAGVVVTEPTTGGETGDVPLAAQSTGTPRLRREARAVSDRTGTSPVAAAAAAGTGDSGAAVAALPPRPRRVRAVPGRGTGVGVAVGDAVSAADETTMISRLVPSLFVAPWRYTSSYPCGHRTRTQGAESLGIGAMTTPMGDSGKEPASACPSWSP